MKPYASGIYHLLGAPNDNFWNGIQNKVTMTKPWCDGYRGRTTLGKIMPSINGPLDLSGPDSAVAVCRANGKKLSLSVSMGFTLPADFYTADPVSTPFAVHDAHGNTFNIPLPWEEAHLRKLAPVIAALGRKYDPDPVISAVFTTGYQDIVECHVLDTNADYAAYSLAAVNYGFLTVDFAWLPIAKKLIDLWCKAFPTTPVMFTAGNPWGGQGNGSALEDELQDYITDTYPEHGGLCSSFLHAKLTHTGVPAVHTYPVGDQAISGSSDDSRFYSPAMPGTQPPAPQPVDDLIKNGYDQGDNYIEIYDADITNSVNWGVIESGRELLLSTVPETHRGGHATLTVIP
jgi:hypothetical protein